MYQVCGAGGEIKPNKSYKILAHYRGKLVPVVRFTLSKDGSIYFSQPFLNAKKVSMQRLKSDEEGKLFVPYNQGDITLKEDAKDKNLQKTTYHASGAINFPDNSRHYSQSLRSIAEPYQVAHMVYTVPDKFGVIEKEQIKSTHMLTGFEISEDHPLQCLLHVSPEPYVPNLKHRQIWVQQLLAKELKDMHDIFVTFTIFDRDASPWPPESGMLMRVNTLTEENN